MKIFKDKDLNLEYLEQGYVKIKLLTNQDCSLIKKMSKKLLRDKHYNQSDISFLPNINTTDKMCQDVHNFFNTILHKRLSKYFTDDFIHWYSTFIIKKPKSASLGWHNDPSYYNHKKFEIPFNIWGGINKINKRNGCMQVIPKSHKLAYDYEAFSFGGLGNSVTSKNLKEVFNQLISKYAIDVPVKKGEVIIHSQSLLHCSYPNKSYFKKRIAFKAIFVPKNLNTLELAFLNERENNLEVYQLTKGKDSINLSQFYDIEKREAITNKKNLIKKIDLASFKLPYTTLEKMEEIMATPNNSLKANFEIC